MKYHANNKTCDSTTAFPSIRGVDTMTHSWRHYILPERKQMTEVYFQPQSIMVEERFLGSPPLPTQENFDIFSFQAMDTAYKRIYSTHPTVINFYFRFHPHESVEEVQYWISSLFDLFGYWVP